MRARVCTLHAMPASASVAHTGLGECRSAMAVLEIHRSSAERSWFNLVLDPSIGYGGQGCGKLWVIEGKAKDVEFI